MRLLRFLIEACHIRASQLRVTTLQFVQQQIAGQFHGELDALQHQGKRFFLIASFIMNASHHRGELWLEAGGGEA